MPIDPDTWVRNSTRSAPSHSTLSAVIGRSPRVYVATSREPAGERCARTLAAAAHDASPGPLGDRCHGPSPQRGCLSYSSCSTSSLPGPGSTSRPAGLSNTEASAPRPSGGGHHEGVVLDRELVGVRPAVGGEPGRPAGTAAATSG